MNVNSQTKLALVTNLDKNVKKPGYIKTFNKNNTFLQKEKKVTLQN